MRRCGGAVVGIGDGQPTRTVTGIYNTSDGLIAVSVTDALSVIPVTGI
jgi:hypothetical protein